MLLNYFSLAIKQLLKHRLYALINITGLSLGLMVFIFGNLLVSYETNHDHMFTKRDQIFVISSQFAESSGIPIKDYPNIRLAYGPLLQKDISSAEHIVRTVHRRFVLSNTRNRFYEGIRFVDPGFVEVFNFQYIKGDKVSSELENGLTLTESTAEKLFGHIDVIGEKILVDNHFMMNISAIVEDVPADSHFNSSLLPDSSLTAFAPISALVDIDDFDITGEWDTHNPADLTYVLLPKSLDKAWLHTQVNQVYEKYTPKKEREYVSGLFVRPLIEQNTNVWEALQFPVIDAVKLLALLVLITACLNYTNLANAQNFSRIREIGLRKTFGANQLQLMVQLLSESLFLVAIATLISMSCVELLVPTYNEWTGKVVVLDYREIMPELVLIVVVVGVFSGVYPAYSIARLAPIKSLRSQLLIGRKGALLRSTMISVQFSISIFILATVMIIFFQNAKVKQLSNTFPRDQISVISNFDEPEVIAKSMDLTAAIMSLEEVQSISLSRGIPFNETGGKAVVTSDALSTPTEVRMVSVDEKFIDTYDIQLLEGRSLDSARSSDIYSPNREYVNVVINQLTARTLKLQKPVVGRSFSRVVDKSSPQQLEYRVVGLIPDQYFLGVHMNIPPLAFVIDAQNYPYASIKFNSNDLRHGEDKVTAQWNKIIKDYPIKMTTLNDYFNRFYRIPKGIVSVLTLFSLIAFSLALFGLFGLTAFIAEKRTKEIGLRKVMGASVSQVLRLLLWQFSFPVMWSMLIAIPLAYFSSSIYLNFFPEQIDFVFPIIIFACLLALIISWLIVIIQAYNAAQELPINSLRYE